RPGPGDPTDRRRHPLPVRLRQPRGILLAALLLRRRRHGAPLPHLPGPGPSGLSAEQRREDPGRDSQRHRCEVRMIGRTGLTLLAGLGILLPISAHAQVRASEPASISQTVDGTKLTVTYSRPRARTRDSLFGKIVTWGE